MSKKLLSAALLAAAWLTGSADEAQFDTGKLYTIESNNNAGKYMQDNGDGNISTGALNANSYWEFEATGNDGCYYVKNARTGKYMQKTSKFEDPVETGDASVEIYIKNDPNKGTNVYGMASTDRSPHDFADDNTYGANYHAGTGIVQGFKAALGARPNSFWKIVAHSFTNGVCADNCTEKYQVPALVDGWYQLTNAGNVEHFAQTVNSGGGATTNAKLMNDIDMNGVTHTPIGYNDNNKFCGTFDGQSHRIKNMTTYSQVENVGFFGGLRGGSTVSNLIIDSSCEITGTNYLGGIAGTCQTPNSSSVTIQNCINEATIHGTGYTIGGIIGYNKSDDLPVNIINCGNSGNIRGDDANACAAMGWAGGKDAKITIRNFWNTGTITKGTTDHLARNGHSEGEAVSFNLYNTEKSNEGNMVLDNVYDASSTASENRSQGTLLDASAAASGKLTYKIGGDWRQAIGTDAHPVFEGPEVLYVGEAGYSTMYDASDDWELNGNAQAYIGTITSNGNALHLTEISDIPAGTAVVISGTYYNKVSTTATASTAGNVLQGSTGSTSGDGSTIYALAMLNDVVGFYLVGDGVTIPAGKAYLVSSAEVKGFTFLFDDDATSIRMKSEESKGEAVYNLAGQRLGKMQKGINIVNGKKVLR